MNRKRLKPAYELTVRDFFARIKSLMEGGQEEDVDLQLPVVKTLRVSPNESNKEIYASGIVYDVTSQIKGSEAGLTAVALPRVFLDWALGSGVKKSVSFDLAKPVKPEFPVGYWCDNSDGSRVYYYHPRCKLLQTGNQEHKTSDDNDPDPSVDYSLRLMPTEEGVWRVRYYTANVEQGKVPLTPEEFFALHPATIEEILAIPDAEKAAVDPVKAAAGGDGAKALAKS